MHEISRELSEDDSLDLVEVFRHLARKFDGAYNLVLLNAMGEMAVLRDPLGIRPLCYAKEGPLFAAASESVALLNLGFSADSIRSLLPGQMIMISPERFELHNFGLESAPSALLLRMDLFCQCRQHSRRAERVPGAQAAG